MKNTLVRAGLTLGLALAATLFTSGTAKAQEYDCNDWNYPDYEQQDCSTYANCLEDNLCSACGNDSSCIDEDYQEYAWYCFVYTCS